MLIEYCLNEEKKKKKNDESGFIECFFFLRANIFEPNEL